MHAGDTGFLLMYVNFLLQAQYIGAYVTLKIKELFINWAVFSLKKPIRH